LLKLGVRGTEYKTNGVSEVSESGGKEMKRKESEVNEVKKMQVTKKEKKPFEFTALTPQELNELIKLDVQTIALDWQREMKFKESRNMQEKLLTNEKD
jgi:hypothetical protein